MTVHRGKIHNYLGVILDYTEGVTLKVSMIDYINEIISSLDKLYTIGIWIKTRAVLEDLYKVDEDYEKLSPDKAKMFHNLLAKTHYNNNMERPDTCTAVAFLKKIFSDPNKDEWRKLVHIMNYIRVTRDLPLILSANGSGVLKLWIDASYAAIPSS